MKNLNLVHLSGLRAVEAVGRLGNLRLAAEELGVTIGAVSQQLQKTERQLGRGLFDRHGRGLTPTALGAEVIGRLTTGMTELSAAVALAQTRSSDTLTVSIAPVLAGKWLVWRLHRFNEAHPDIHVRVEASVALVDPNTSDVDLCIRVGQGGWPDVMAERILGHRVFPVCSPILAKQLKSPADLANVPIIRDVGSTFDWDAWLAPQGFTQAMLGSGPEFSDAMLCIDAAIAGQGVFLAWDTLANDPIEFGQLVAPFPGRHPSGLTYWFVTSRHAPRSPAVEAFKRWIKAELDASVSREDPDASAQSPAPD